MYSLHQFFLHISPYLCQFLSHLTQRAAAQNQNVKLVFLSCNQWQIYLENHHKPELWAPTWQCCLALRWCSDAQMLRWCCMQCIMQCFWQILFDAMQAQPRHTAQTQLYAKFNGLFSSKEGSPQSWQTLMIKEDFCSVDSQIFSASAFE